MGGIRRHHTLIAWLALAGMIVNLAVAFACCIPAKPAGDYPAELLGALVICFEHGTQTLPDDDGAPAPLKPCPMCSVALSFTLAAVAAILLGLLTPPRSEPIPLVFIATFADRLLRAGLGSRAPPLSA